jgi:hypothetical protein
MENVNFKNETPADAKPVLCEVAVLSAYRRNFDLWVKENRKEGERYHCVSRMSDVWGQVFHRVEKSHRWVEMPDFIGVERRCLERVRNLA